MKKNEAKSGEILIYQNQDGRIKIDVRLENETVWLTQDQMATLFGKARNTITEHIQNVYEEGELEQNRTSRKFRQVRTEGKRAVEREIDHYNLDVIISVGYRVKSLQGTQFRIWATQRLKEYIIKGFALNDDRFKSGSSMNYFNELQDRIRGFPPLEPVHHTDQATDQVTDQVQNLMSVMINEHNRTSSVNRVSRVGKRVGKRTFIPPN
jgi:hypothetical protein